MAAKDPEQTAGAARERYQTVRPLGKLRCTAYSSHASALVVDEEGRTWTYPCRDPLCSRNMMGNGSSKLEADQADVHWSARVLEYYCMSHLVRPTRDLNPAPTDQHMNLNALAKKVFQAGTDKAFFVICGKDCDDSHKVPRLLNQFYITSSEQKQIKLPCILRMVD